MTDKELIAAHLSTIITIVLEKTSYRTDESNPLAVRAEACRIFAKIAKLGFEYSILHPYRSKVIKQLATPCLDHKRLVRVEAVEARNLWYLLSGK